FDNFIKTLDTLNRDIDARREQISRTETVQKEKQNAEAASKAEAARVAERNRKVNEALARVRALQQERKYKEALQVVEQTLFLDPHTPRALLLRDIIRDITVYQRYNTIHDERTFRDAGQSLDNADAMIPNGNLVDFPTDWPKKTFDRGETSAFADTPENRKVL